MTVSNRLVFNKYYNFFILLLSLIFLGLNYKIFHVLFERWYAYGLTGLYSQGFLVVLIVVYLVYIKIRKIREFLFINPSIFGFSFFLVSQCLLFLAVMAGINFVQDLLLPASLLFLAWAVYGYKIAKQFLLPTLLFTFVIPVWSGLEYPLQTVSVFVTNIMLGLTNLPYYHNHQFFHFPSGVIEIAPECAGLQQLLVSIIIGLLFSVQNNLRLLDTIKTLIYLSILAILVNSIRIIIIMYVGYYTKMESSLLYKHQLLGWVIYGIGIFIFLHIYSRRDFRYPAMQAKANLDEVNQKYSKHTFFLFYIALFILVLLPLGLQKILVYSINSRNSGPAQYSAGDHVWIKIENNIDIDWRPIYPKASGVIKATYSNGKSKLYLYVNSYNKLELDIDPINMNNRPYSPRTWKSSQRRGFIDIFSNAGQRIRLRFDYLQSRTHQTLAVLSYYIINGKITNSLIRAKLAILEGVLKQQYNVKIVNLAIPISSNNKNAKVLLTHFFQTLHFNS